MCYPPCNHGSGPPPRKGKSSTQWPLSTSMIVGEGVHVLFLPPHNLDCHPYCQPGAEPNTVVAGPVLCKFVERTQGLWFQSIDSSSVVVGSPLSSIPSGPSKPRSQLTLFRQESTTCWLVQGTYSIRALSPHDLRA